MVVDEINERGCGLNSIEATGVRAHGKEAIELASGDGRTRDMVGKG